MSDERLETLRQQAGALCALYFATMRRRGLLGYCPGCLVRDLERRDLVAEANSEALYRLIIERARERAAESAEESAEEPAAALL